MIPKVEQIAAKATADLIQRIFCLNRPFWSRESMFFWFVGNKALFFVKSIQANGLERADCSDPYQQCA
jgi:hypothetical protein